MNNDRQKIVVYDEMGTKVIDSGWLYMNGRVVTEVKQCINGKKLYTRPRQRLTLWKKLASILVWCFFSAVPIVGIVVLFAQFLQIVGRGRWH